MVRIVSALALALVAGCANAQVASPGTPVSKSIATINANTVVNLPTIDVEESAAAFSMTKDREGGEEFGLDQFIHADNTAVGEWTQITNEQWLWRYTVRSEGARGLLPVFSKWHMPTAGRFFVYSDQDQAGSFTSKNNKPNGQFAVRPVKGDTITLEYNGPREGLELEVEKVIHVYRDLFGSEKGFGDSGSCNVNVVCQEGDDYEEQIDSVTVLLNTQSRGYCSGSMINSVDGSQLFLTAFHCRPGANDIIAFNYESATCPYPGTNPGGFSDTAQGLQTLASGAASDYHLLRVIEEIPDHYDAYLNGWDATVNDEGSTPYSSVFGIHHPSVDVKKISMSSSGATVSGYLGAGRTHYWVKTWEINRSPNATDYGTTEGGSSGSPLFSSEGRIIGQLHGGYASCFNNVDDYYGALFVSFPALEEFLTGGSGVLVMDGQYLAAKNTESHLETA